MKNIHFVFGLKDRELGLCDRLAIASAWDHNPDFTVHLWTPQEPVGEHWEKLIARVPVKVMPIDDPKDWNGHKIPQHQHRADLIRHTVLYTMGGVYCDTDTLTLAKYPDWWFEEDAVVGIETSSGEIVGLCNAVMACRMHSQFQWKWLEAWQEFDGSGWNEFSVRRSLKIHNENPGLCVPTDKMLGHMYNDLEKYWEGIHPTDSIIAHVWRTYSKDIMARLTENDVLERSNTYGFYAADHL